MSNQTLLVKNLEQSITAKKQFIDDKIQQVIFEKAIHAVINCYKNGGRIYIAGNGGSAADAQHLAAEFVSKLARDRSPLPAEALTVDSSIITAIGNDYGYDQVFARQIEGKCTKSDIFLAITTSGNSPNILKALEKCKTIGILSILFTGKDGGAAKDLADYCIIAPGESTAIIQELHLVMEHTLCESVENAFFQ